MTRQDASRRGGRAPASRHGRPHMQRIGRHGFVVALARLEARKTDAQGNGWEPYAWLLWRVRRAPRRPEGA